MNNYDVVVIGGGASGMMAAAVAAQRGARVLLVEKNAKLGRKLAITGGGRCNILNAEEDQRLLLSNYGKADKFLFSAFSQFGMEETRHYFESRGMKLKIEDRKRAFPASESAPAVVALLENELAKHGVTVRQNAEVNSIYAANGEIKYIKVNGDRIFAQKYILATGGVSKPETGSTGDGFKWIKSMGHVVNEPTPNVTPLATKESWVEKVAGTKATGAAMTFFCDKKKEFRVSGDVLFTHFGLSGPTILNSASRVADILQSGVVTIEIDCFPKMNHKELDTSVLQILDEHKTKQLKNTLRFIAPEGLSKVFAELLSGEELQSKNSELSKATRQKLIKLMKGIPLTIDRLMGFEKAVVADGGLALPEIDTRTMRSKRINNLFITGDLLDINRPSGGYSLQLCWTSGYLAGIHSAREVEK